MTSVDHRPLVLIISGPPCTGKTTLARRLATDLGLPLMCKDTIKEVLFERLCAQVMQRWQAPEPAKGAHR